MYRRRRAFAGVAMAGAVGVAALVAGGVLAGPGGDPASAAGAGTALSTPHRVVRVRAGDTLWSIAVEHHGDAPLMRYLDALIDRNGGTVIEVGQLVELP